MADAAVTPTEVTDIRRPLKTSGFNGDAAFRYITMAGAMVVVVIIAWIGVRLFQQSALTRHTFGWHFLNSSTWDVPHREFGALPYIFGTFVSSTLALIISVPLGVGCAVFLSEYAPTKVAAVVS